MKNTISRKNLRALVATTLAVVVLLLMTPSTALAKRRYYRCYTVSVNSGYLALRTAPAYDDRNEIGELYTGDVVRLVDANSNATYWKVYSPKYQRRGWVNKNYLRYFDAYTQDDFRVYVTKGYLALRAAPAYDERNEIGALYTDDVVTLINRYNNTYWWVYSSKYGKCGYVNANYLRSLSEDNYGDYTVRVDKGYLALRTAPAYDDRNEIGKLHTGDVVIVKDKSQGTYWWVYSTRLDRSGYVNKNYLVW